LQKENNNKELMVCTPVHSNVSIHFMKACLDLQKECLLNKIKVTFQLMKSSLVTQGRNLCVSSFLNSEATHMLFIDSDINFTVRSVYRLFNSPYQISCIPYPMKTTSNEKFRLDYEKRPDDNIETMGQIFPISLKDHDNLTLNNGFIEVERAPTGMMMITRSAFEDLIKGYPELYIKQSTMLNGVMEDRKNYYNFFDTYWSPKDKTYMGEDFYFCKLWKSMGGKIHALVDEEISHIGDKFYSGKLIDEFTKKQ